MNIYYVVVVVTFVSSVDRKSSPGKYHSRLLGSSADALQPLTIQSLCLCLLGRLGHTSLLLTRKPHLLSLMLAEVAFDRHMHPSLLATGLLPTGCFLVTLPLFRVLCGFPQRRSRLGQIVPSHIGPGSPGLASCSEAG